MKRTRSHTHACILRCLVQVAISCRCFAASCRHTESSVAAARASAQPYPMRQRVTSPEGSLAHSAISFLCRAASARHVESACSCAIESCSCWYVVAAVRAAACVHLYCSTRHCAAPLASMVILLHSRTSAAFLAADLKQPRADAVTAAANQAFVQRIGASKCGLPERRTQSRRR